MGRNRPKLAPLTPEQEEAVHSTASFFFGEAVDYANSLNAYFKGKVKTRPRPPEDLDPGIARATEEWLDAIGLRAEEIVMEPFDAAA